MSSFVRETQVPTKEAPKPLTRGDVIATTCAVALLILLVLGFLAFGSWALYHEGKKDGAYDCKSDL